jgi:hypothetical protein
MEEKSQSKPWQANKTNLQKKLYSVTKKIVLAERVSQSFSISQGEKQEE